MVKKNLEKVERRMKLAESLGSEINHIARAVFDQGTGVITMHIYCNTCGREWTSTTASYVRAKTGCYTCAHLSPGEVIKLEEKELEKTQSWLCPMSYVLCPIPRNGNNPD